jgi:hypothetical protein
MKVTTMIHIVASYLDQADETLDTQLRDAAEFQIPTDKLHQLDTTNLSR